MTNPFLRPDGQPYLIAEFGSCHLGKLENIKRAVDECVFHGIDALKLQLFPDAAPYVPTNIHLPQEMFLRAFEYANGKGLALTASVFDEESLQFLLKLKPKFIKLSYSKKEKHGWLDELILREVRALISCDVMTDNLKFSKESYLYCIPEYPVRYEVNFDEIFPRFDGFSDHTLGTCQTRRAIAVGAKIIEKHVRLPETDIRACPDARFAVTIEELGKVRL